MDNTDHRRGAAFFKKKMISATIGAGLLLSTGTAQAFAPQPAEAAGVRLGAEPASEGPRGGDSVALPERAVNQRAIGLLSGAGGALGLGLGLELASAYVTAKRCIDPVMLDAAVAPALREETIAGCKSDTGELFALQAGAGSSLLAAVGLAGAGGWYLGLRDSGRLDIARAAQRERVTIGLGGLSLGLSALTLGTAIAAIPGGWPTCSEAECFNGRTRAVVMSTTAAASFGAVGAGLLTYGLALRSSKRARAGRLEAQLVPSLSPRAAGLTLAGRF